MPTGPEGQKRPADAIGNAAKVAPDGAGDVSTSMALDFDSKLIFLIS